MIVIVEHTVEDYEAWKRGFDEHRSVQDKHGMTDHRLYRSSDDPNTVTLLCRFPSREAAEGFLNDPSLAEAMQHAGVLGAPRITTWEEVEALDHAARAAT